MPLHFDPDEMPQGDENPDRLFAAVGHAISAWEQLELEMANSYSIFIGHPGKIDALAEYGKANPALKYRLAATETAAKAFFIRNRDQENECTFATIMADIASLAIERHRIAHGAITRLPVVTPGSLDENGWFSPLDNMRYFIGAPWYSIDSLKMSFASLDSELIDRRATAFLVVCSQLAQLNQSFSLAASQEKPAPQFLAPSTAPPEGG